MSTLAQLCTKGQAFWIDFIRRDLLDSDAFQRLIVDDGLAGMTSNPAIFEQAIRQGPEYGAAIRELVGRGVREAQSLYEHLAIDDVRQAADALRRVYDATEARDGYVSFEVSPHLAHDGEATLVEARRLWAAVDRPNLMIKIPGTPAGFPVIEALLRDAINVNVTLLFSHDAYERAAQAYLGALERRAAHHEDLRCVASVASFFVSRIDSAVDSRLQARAGNAVGSERVELERLKGKAAVAWAKLAYRRYRQLFAGPRWQHLAAAGARPQRLLWASTSTKNPAYRDVVYVEELIGPDTVNTMPPATIDAFRDHGTVALTLEHDLDEAQGVLQAVERSGISMQEVTDSLLADGVRKFVEPFDSLLAALASRRDEVAR